MTIVKNSKWSTSPLRVRGVYSGKIQHSKVFKVGERHFYVEIIETITDSSCFATAKEIKGDTFCLGRKTCYASSLEEAKKVIKDFIVKKTGGTLNE